MWLDTSYIEDSKDFGIKPEVSACWRFLVVNQEIPQI